MWGSQQILGVPGPQQLIKTFGSLWLSSSTEDRPAPGPSSSCPLSEISCRTKYHGQDTCCFNYPGGQMLQTQFWDVDPALGPDDSWTIHGLWPDHCNGGFDQFCDSSRKYSNISLILVDSGRGDLLEYLSEYWKDFRGDDSNLWQHEWNKHGTCVSTLDTHCYEDYVPQQEVVDYFDKTAEIFKTLPSHEFLSAAGILPSHSQTYDLADIENALEQAHGAPVSVRCRNHALNEIWYHFNIAGSLQTGKFIPAGPGSLNHRGVPRLDHELNYVTDGQKSNCPSKGIHYPPKRSQGEPTKTTTHGSAPTATGAPFSGKGNLIVSSSGQKHGCLISHGTWYTSGTCATFRAEKATGDAFTLKSSKGKCAIVKDALACGDHIESATEFTAKDSQLSHEGSIEFSADQAPRGQKQSEIYASSAHPIDLRIIWKSNDY